MWTNIFRVSEFQVMSWFQFLPSEPDPMVLHEKSSKAEQKDAATCSVLSAHLKLQNDGFLSTWTNSFVGPWDPSQGVHNPDDKIKLWLFLPGRQSSVVDTAQSTVSTLRVVGRGVWFAPGDSEEVAVALSQALRNSIGRALRGLSYMRYGDVFTKNHSPASSGKSIRKVQPTCEFIFAATEEAIYIHVIVSVKHIRNLNDDDIERVLTNSSSNLIGKGLPVVVSPNGMLGRLTGCCPTDLMMQVYTSKHKATSESAPGLSSTMQSSGCHLRGQSCFVEVTLGCPSTSSEAAQEKRSSQEIKTIKPNSEDPGLVSSGKGQKSDPFPILERTFIYPAESVLVPVLHRAFARSSLKRFFLKGWIGTSLDELWPFWKFSCSSQFKHCEFLEALGIDFSGTGLKRKYNSSSNSSCSSTSSTDSTSSGSEHADGTVTGDLEANADSLTSRQSGLSSNDQFDNDGKKMVSKRLRSSVTDVFSRAAKVASATAQNAVRSEFSIADANNSTTVGSAIAQVGSSWDWDDEDRGVGIDIQILLSEFGGFGDFFENDVLDFGEPPGTAESQAIICTSIECGDIVSSPCMVGIDSPDPRISAAGFTSFENFNQPYSASTEDTQSKSLDADKDAKSSAALSNSLVLSNGKFDYLTKAEDILTFAPEYAAVEMFSNELCTSIFRNPYLPGSKRVESSLLSSCAYVYSATPPSPYLSDMEENLEKSSKLKPDTGLYLLSTSSQFGKLYTHVQSVSKKIERRLLNDVIPLHKGQNHSVSVVNSCSGTTLQRNNDNTFEADHFLLSLETLLATEIECMIFQVAMCRIRHTLLSFSSRVPIVLNKLNRDSMLDLVSYDSSSMPDVFPTKHEGQKKDVLPIRIAGDNIGMIDPPITTSVGVWRSVGVPKGTKPLNTNLSQNSPSLPLNQSNEEIFAFHGQRYPLQELLDAIGLLVQQAASLVDVSLDMDDVDGSYSWLALEEQQRRGFSCCPSMVHAGCGGIFASCHYVDIAGIELINPLSADVIVSNVISLLQSDIKLGLKSAFSSSEGPLSLTEWCRGRHQLGDLGVSGDAYPFQFTMGESKDSLSTVSLGGEAISPPQPGGGSSCIREGVRSEDSTQRRSSQDICGSESDAQKLNSRLRPTITVISSPALLVGYQDDWLKTSVNCLQLWEKAPLEPYALSKPVSYYVVCPDIDLLTSASTDFFQQLGTVYEACKLGSHTPQVNGGLLESSSAGNLTASGILLVNCPQELKTASSNMLSISSITDYFIALSKRWNVKGYLNSLKKALKDLKIAANPSPNQKEHHAGPSMVVYVVCPFPEPKAVLKTLIECSAGLGSGAIVPDKERQPLLYKQVAKALISSAPVDEASSSNVVMLSGFRIPKLVLQIVTVDSLLRLNKPSKELAIFKEIAFTVYNKVRRISRTVSGADLFQSSATSGRTQSTLMHVTSPIPGIWKDCLAPRISGSALSREPELDPNLRPVTWDNSWQTSRMGGLNSDSTRSMDLLQDDPSYVFEPLFILAEPGSVEHGYHPAVFHSTMSEPSSSKSVFEDNNSYVQTSNTGAADIGKGSPLDGLEHGSRAANLHCSYGWTEDWRWLICMWTDSRGELLDCSIFPFGGISSRQDTKFLQNLFVQLLHHSCQILANSSLELGNRPRDIIITRIGCFFELECQEWQKAIYSVGGNEVKKWPIQLRRAMPDGVLSSNNGIEQHEMGLIQERVLPPLPSPLYNPHAKSSFMKGGLGQTNAKKQMLGGQTGLDSSRGLLQLAQSISLVSVTLDHSLHLILPSDLSSLAGGGQNNSSSGLSGYLEGFSPVKSFASTSCSYLLIPSPSMRFLPPSPLQLPTCLTSESPPLAHLLHSKGSAIPQSTGFVVSKSIPATRKDFVEPIKEDSPSILSVSLVDHYSGSSILEKLAVRGSGTGAIAAANKQGRSMSGLEAVTRDYETEGHLVLESIAAELHSLSWMTVSPLFPERRSALPFHCDILLRLRRLLHFADREFSQAPANEQFEPAGTDL